MRNSAKRRGREELSLLLVLACLAWASPAMAQDDAGAAAAADGGGEAGEGGAEEGGEVDPIPTEIDKDDPRYWAQVRGISTVQKRDILKEGRLGVTLYTGIIPNNIFAQYFPVGLRLNYFVLENLGLELAGNYSCGFMRDDEEKESGRRKCGLDTGLTRTLLDDQGVGSSSVLLGDEQIAHFNFGVVWSPVFGKTAWHNKSLKYFDMYLFGGVGTVVKQTTPDIGADPSVGVDVEGALGAGLMYFLGERFALRLDFRQFLFRKITGGVATPSEVSLGLTFMP